MFGVKILKWLPFFYLLLAEVKLKIITPGLVV